MLKKVVDTVGVEDVTTAELNAGLLFELARVADHAELFVVREARLCINAAGIEAGDAFSFTLDAVASMAAILDQVALLDERLFLICGLFSLFDLFIIYQELFLGLIFFLFFLFFFNILDAHDIINELVVFIVIFGSSYYDVDSIEIERLELQNWALCCGSTSLIPVPCMLENQLDLVHWVETFITVHICLQ